MNILVRLPNWLGDVMMSLTLLQELHRLQPESEIDVIVKKELTSLPDLLPFIKTVHGFSKSDFPGIGGVYRFGKNLSKQKKYDYFFCLPDSFSSALMGFASRASNRVGYAGQWRTAFLTTALAKPVNLHRTQEYLYLLEKTFRTRFSEPVFRFEAVEKKHIIVLNFNSEASSRRMPLQKACDIITALQHQFAYQIVLVGSPKEQTFISQIVALLPNQENLVNIAGKTTLMQLIHLIASAALMISTDSGSAHLATAAKTPLLVFFGAGNETNTGPFRTNRAAVVRLKDLPCSPCLKNTCALYDKPKCLTDLDVTEIINQAGILLATPADVAGY